MEDPASDEQEPQGQEVIVQSKVSYLDKKKDQLTAAQAK